MAMAALKVLVIEDELAAREVLAAAISDAGYVVDSAGTFAEARDKLTTGDFDVALCDIQLPDGNGIELLKHCRTTGLETLFVMATAFASVETAVEALRAGAYDYIVKPVRHAEVGHRLAQIQSLAGLRAENRALKTAARSGHPLYWFESAEMARIDRLVVRLAPLDTTVLITGESGTGKSVLARSIHERSRRADGPFLQVNCGAIPDQLLESEFFGNTKGAFTGADHARKGLFVEADRGTLLLDEIGELPLLMQTKLLHIIENKEVRALGSAQARHVDTRIIAATNRRLDDLVREGRFREDLYFRLKILEIAIPPLRERSQDLQGLIRFCLDLHRGSKSGPPLSLDPDAQRALLAYSWPGNVREVQNAMTRACILADGDTIYLHDLPSEVQDAFRRGTSDASGKDGESLDALRRRFELDAIRKAIESAAGDRRLAAQRLGISVSSLYRKLEGLSVDRA
jgi:two-component system, NtrC family, response regulator AtoC